MVGQLLLVYRQRGVGREGALHQQLSYSVLIGQGGSGGGELDGKDHGAAQILGGELRPLAILLALLGGLGHQACVQIVPVLEGNLSHGLAVYLKAVREGEKVCGDVL